MFGRPIQTAKKGKFSISVLSVGRSVLLRPILSFKRMIKTKTAKHVKFQPQQGYRYRGPKEVSFTMSVCLSATTG